LTPLFSRSTFKKKRTMKKLNITASFTDKCDRSVAFYLQEISKIPRITLEEEITLAQRIRNKDMQARDDLVRANLLFVVSVAKQYLYLGMPLQDMINEGNIGLIEAATRFDETRGIKFVSYAVWWIRRAIKIAYAAYGKSLRFTPQEIALANKVALTIDRLYVSYGFTPTFEDVAREMQKPIEEVESGARIYYLKNYSFDAPAAEDNESTLLDTVEDNTISIEQSAGIEHRKAATVLLLKQVLKSQSRYDVFTAINDIYCDEQLTAGQLARRKDLTETRICQLNKEAKDALLKNKRAMHLLKTA
jgi:RNA polymerase primary sigma factor